MAQYSSGDNIPSRSGSSEENENKKLILTISEQEFVLLPNGSDPVSDNRAINPPGGGLPYLKKDGGPLLGFKKVDLVPKNFESNGLRYFQT